MPLGWIPVTWVEFFAAVEALVLICLAVAGFWFVIALVIYGANIALVWVTRVRVPRRVAPRSYSLHPSHFHRAGAFKR